MIKYEMPLKVRSIVKIGFGPTSFFWYVYFIFLFSIFFIIIIINLAFTSMFAFPSIKDCVPVQQLPKESRKLIHQALRFHLLE
jgi:hypothetical protein